MVDRTADTPAPAPPRRGRVVVVDDEENMVKILGKILSLEGWLVTGFSDPVEAVRHIQQTPPEVVLTDMKMPNLTGMDVIRETRAADAASNVVVMTAYGTVEGVLDAVRAGAFDYVTKPFKTDELLMTLDRALERTRLLRENEVLSDLASGGSVGSADDILGESAAIKGALSLADRAAVSNASILLLGESGTGKELFARRIHRKSRRNTGRFVAINCASIPDQLLESELFGHEKGSFTGADRTKIGLVELAHGGTLFLDEIGEMPLRLQGKLLRVLQEREIQRVGGLQAIAVDVRVVAATNRGLQAAAEAGEFRQDLLYRLDVVRIELPPLRERREDIPQLVKQFLRDAVRRLGHGPQTIAQEAMDALSRWKWPGNVREVRNVAERLAVLAEGAEVQMSDLPADFLRPTAAEGPDTMTGPTAAGLIDYRVAKDRFEREFIVNLLKSTGGNVSEAARVSGLSRRHLHEKMQKLGVRGDE